MSQSDQSVALLISLQERVNKVFDDIKNDREIDREQLNLLVERVEKLEQAGREVKKHKKVDVSVIIQNPTVLFAIITVVALLLVGNVDLNVIIGKFLDWLGK